MPKLWVRILFFLLLAVGFVALAWMGSSERREEQEQRINAQRRAQPSGATQPAP